MEAQSHCGTLTALLSEEEGCEGGWQWERERGGGGLVGEEGR